MKDIILLELGRAPNTPVETCDRCGKPPGQYLYVLKTDEDPVAEPVLLLCGPCLGQKANTATRVFDAYRKHGSIRKLLDEEGLDERLL